MNIELHGSTYVQDYRDKQLEIETEEEIVRSPTKAMEEEEKDDAPCSAAYMRYAVHV